MSDLHFFKFLTFGHSGAQKLNHAEIKNVG